MERVVRVEVWLDILCPWCVIGESRLAAAIRRTVDPSRVEVVWRSWELGPNLDRVPGPTAADAMRERVRSADEAEARLEHICRLASSDGIDLNLEEARPVNSFDAHRLLHLGAEHGRSGEVLSGLLYGYHTEARNIADHDVLTAIGVAAGLDKRDIVRVLGGDAYADAVREDERRGMDLGIAGVPTMIIDGGQPLPGARDVEELRTLLDNALARVTT